MVNHSTSQRRPVRAYGAVIGYIEGDRFIKHVVGSKHRLKVPPAWAIDADAFDNIIRGAVAELVILDTEDGSRYAIPVPDFDRLKRGMDRGHGRQYFVTLAHWRVGCADGSIQCPAQPACGVSGKDVTQRLQLALWTNN